MAATKVLSCYPMNCLLLCTNTLAFGKLLWYLMMPNCLNSGLRYKAGWRTPGVPMVLHGDEVPVVGIGKIFFLIAPYLPILHFFWVPWTLSSRSYRPCTWGFGQIQTGQGAGITTALLKVGMLELLWLEVMLVCCWTWIISANGLAYPKAQLPPDLVPCAEHSIQAPTAGWTTGLGRQTHCADCQ